MTIWERNKFVLKIDGREHFAVYKFYLKINF